jgi:hypothetical protein
MIYPFNNLRFELNHNNSYFTTKSTTLISIHTQKKKTLKPDHEHERQQRIKIGFSEIEIESQRIK